MHSLTNMDTNDLKLKTKLKVTVEPFFYTQNGDWKTIVDID